MTKIKTLMDAALRYAAHGFRVFPLVPGGTTPATAHGLGNATTDPMQIIKWWTENPNYNVAIATGATQPAFYDTRYAPYDLFVLDIDTKKGTDGRILAKAIEAELGKLPPTVGQKTPTGGIHLFFKVPCTEQFGCGVDVFKKLARGVDVHCNGGYVVAAPSVTEEGVYTAHSGMTYNAKRLKR